MDSLLLVILLCFIFGGIQGYAQLDYKRRIPLFMKFGAIVAFFGILFGWKR